LARLAAYLEHGDIRSAHALFAALADKVKQGTFLPETAREIAAVADFQLGKLQGSETPVHPARADGSVHVGCNVENASYGLAMCAERVALGAAVAAGVRSFTRVAVVTDADPPAAPCGACRQVLSEFAPDAVVVSIGSRTTLSWRVAELLPAAFSRHQLP